MSHIMRVKSIAKAYDIAEAHKLDMAKPDYKALRNAPGWHQRKCGMNVVTEASFGEYWAVERTFRLSMQERRYGLFRDSGFIRLLPFEVEDAYDLLVETDILHRGDDEFVEDVFGPDAVHPERSMSFWRQVDEFVDKAGEIVGGDMSYKRNLYLFVEET